MQCKLKSCTECGKSIGGYGSTGRLKLSLAGLGRKGRTHSMTCRCASCLGKGGLFKGEKNPNWQGGKSKFHCIDCKKLLTNYNVRRCQNCQTIWKRGSNSVNWRGGKPLCQNCGKNLTNYSSKYCLECRYLVLVGDKHPCWKGGISFLPYSHQFNRYLKEKIRTRDSNVCRMEICGMDNDAHLAKYRQNLQIHHIDYNKQNCEESNLITVCRKCNAIANFNRDYWFAYFTHLMEIVYEEVHTFNRG